MVDVPAPGARLVIENIDCPVCGMTGVRIIWAWRDQKADGVMYVLQHGKDIEHHEGQWPFPDIPAPE